MMQASVVPDGVASNAEDLFQDPQLKHYHHFHEQNHPAIGKYVYTKILGIPDDEFVQLQLSLKHFRR